MEQTDVIDVLEAHRTELTTWVLVLLRDRHTAEDLFQEMFVKALGQPEHFSEPQHVMAWARVNLRHRAINYIQRYRDRMATLDEQAIESLCDHAEERMATEGNARSEALKDCLKKLPTKSSQLLRLRYSQDLSGVAIAQSLGKSTDAIYQSLSRIHQKLRACVESLLQRKDRHT